MSLLKFKKTDNGNDQDWIALYAEAIRNRLRIDLNLSDVSNKATARTNLGIYGDENTTHYHDHRYYQKSYVDSKFKSLEETVKNYKLTITGKCTSSTVSLTPNSNVNINISAVKADTTNVTNKTDGNKFIALVDGIGQQEIHDTDKIYVNCNNKTLYVTNVSCTSVQASGDIRANRVFNAVWNDYAELMPRGGITEPGDIVMLDLRSKDEKYIRAYENDLPLIVAGVHSDEFGMLIGGEKPIDSENLLDYNIDKYIPVALSGRVHVKFIGKAEKGAKVVPSSEPGYGRLYNKGVDDPDTVIGYLVESDDRTDKRKLKIRITR